MTDLTLKDIERLRGIAKEAHETRYLGEFEDEFDIKTVLKLLELAEERLKIKELNEALTDSPPLG